MGTRVKSAMAKCLSCQRWVGERSLSADRLSIGHDPDVRGICNGGPWHGTLREPRNACGRWVVWAAIKISRAA